MTLNGRLEGGATFARAVLEERAKRLLGEFSKLKKHPGQESIHDTRVASRRMRAALEAFRELLPPDRWEETYSVVRFLTRALGRAREAEVVAALAAEVIGGGDVAENVSREYLEERFRREHLRRERKMRSEISALGIRRLRRQLDSVETALESPLSKRRRIFPAAKKGPGRAAPGPLLAQATRTLRELATSVVSFPVRREFARASDSRLHRLRIADKRLRYALEIYDPVWPGGLKREIEMARGLQDAAGTHQDWAVLRGRLKKEIRRLTKRHTSHLAFQIGRLLARVEEHKASARTAILQPLVEIQLALQERFPSSIAAGRKR